MWRSQGIHSTREPAKQGFKCKCHRIFAPPGYLGVSSQKATECSPRRFQEGLPSLRRRNEVDDEGREMGRSRAAATGHTHIGGQLAPGGSEDCPAGRKARVRGGEGVLTRNNWHVGYLFGVDNGQVVVEGPQFGSAQSAGHNTREAPTQGLSSKYVSDPPRETRFPISSAARNTYFLPAANK